VSLRRANPVHVHPSRSPVVQPGNRVRMGVRDYRYEMLGRLRTSARKMLSTLLIAEPRSQLLTNLPPHIRLGPGINAGEIDAGVRDAISVRSIAVSPRPAARPCGPLRSPSTH
jgi:hypothetical protein